ncbi:TrkH family potassium uptake protein [Aerococcus kribbianus]|uniref:TrkH family potassium uptake protein n=1 Tax=Aerococcus kribbianus TaxID=2999064 RepID=A0A9X3FNE1_9LACT|nr:MULTISPECIES: TrkH family potassium uptake protein [unclassified Aerococcus]MCZ0716806.1 TrkH family potassium uptake protein [Aerococcus sp. YH-aer221]MCZ0725094.1 TrkH family potassium uptake protein [Aerococcus sp. YH-aer222]
MNWPFTRFLIGRLLFVLAGLMLVPIIVALIYQNDWQVIRSFLVSIIACLVVGGALSYKSPQNTLFFAREGYILVALSWIVYGFFGALPFYFSGYVTSPVDAFFESVSGFTTTGASVLSEHLHVLPEALMFWRSFTLLIGGMGMLIFLMYIIPNFGAKGVYVMRAELPGPNQGKIESRVSHSILILYGIYIFLTILVTVLLVVGHVPVFEAMLLAMGVAGTGGFNIYPSSIGHYNSQYVETVLAIAMFTFGMNFNFFYLIFIGRIKEVLKDEELKWYVQIILASCAVIAFTLWPSYDDFSHLLSDVFFNVTSVISTTAYTNLDLLSWPLTTHIIILVLMFSGAMSGSTTSGLKVIRIGIFLKSIRQEIRSMVSPDRVVPVTFNGRALTPKMQRGIAFYLMTYLFMFVVLLIILSFDTVNFSSAFSATIATLSNIGGSLNLLGPSQDYVQLSDFSKVIMSFAMIMGRLEIYPMLVLLSPASWRKI